MNMLLSLGSEVRKRLQLIIVANQTNETKKTKKKHTNSNNSNSVGR